MNDRWLRPGVRLSERPIGLEDGRPTNPATRILMIAPLFAAEAVEAIRNAKQSQSAAALRKVKAVAVPDAALWGRDAQNADYGPGHQHRSIGGRAPRIEVMEQPDPANARRDVRRGVVHDPLRRMMLRGEIQARHCLAARRFRQAVEVAEAVYPSRSLVLVPAGGGFGSTLPVGASASRSVRRAVLAIIGPPNELVHLTVFVAIAIERWTIKDLALRLVLRRTKVAEMLKQALEALATHYGLVEDAATRRLALL